MKISPVALVLASLLIVALVHLGMNQSQDHSELQIEASTSLRTENQEPIGVRHADASGTEIRGGTDREKQETEPGENRAVVGKPVIDSFIDELSELTVDDSEFVMEFNERLFGALEFRSAAEREWKASRGYPTIEDVLRSRDMTDDELLAWAKSGDPVGTLLNYERQLSRLIEMQGDLGVTVSNRTELIEENLELGELIQGLQRGQLDILSTQSPFSAYLLSAYNEATRNEVFGHYALVSAALAGDYHAMQQVQSVFETLNPQMVVSSEGVPLVAYDSAAVDSVLAFIRTGLYQASGPLDQGVICQQPSLP